MLLLQNFAINGFKMFRLPFDNTWYDKSLPYRSNPKFPSFPKSFGQHSESSESESASVDNSETESNDDTDTEANDNSNEVRPM